MPESQSAPMPISSSIMVADKVVEEGPLSFVKPSPVASTSWLDDRHVSPTDLNSKLPIPPNGPTQYQNTAQASVNKGKAQLGQDFNIYYTGPLKKTKKRKPKIVSKWKVVIPDPCLNRTSHSISEPIFDPISVELQGLKPKSPVKAAIEVSSNADDEAEFNPNPVALVLPYQVQEPPLVSDSESDFSSSSLSEFLPLPWHDKEDLNMQLIGSPTVVETSKWKKMAMAKACKAFGVNFMGLEHEILGIILRMEQKRQLQLQQQKKNSATKKGKNKRESELKKLNWGLNDSARKGRGRLHQSSPD